jgi:hypothetical protein
VYFGARAFTEGTGAGRDTELMLDLKDHDPGLPERVLAAIGTSGRCDGITVCSQDWRPLEPFAAHPEIRVVHSIHQRLLDGAVVQDLRRRAALVLSWPVESGAESRGTRSTPTTSGERASTASPTCRRSCRTRT